MRTLNASALSAAVGDLQQQIAQIQAAVGAINSGSNGTPTVVYAPGLPKQQGNLYPTFAGAVAALNKYNGAPTFLAIDDEIAPGTATLTPGAYNLAGITIVGQPHVPISHVETLILTIPAGVTFTFLWRNIENVAIVASGSSVPVYVLQDGDQAVFGSTCILESSPIAFFRLAAGATAEIIANGPSTVLGDGTNLIASGPAGSTLNVTLGNSSLLNTNAVGGLLTLSIVALATSLGAGPQEGVTGGVTSPGASPLARGWSTNLSAVLPDSVAATIVTSVTVTPKATGRFRVQATGTTLNASGGAINIFISLSHGTSASPADYGSIQVQPAAGGTTSFAIVADYDKIPTPLVFPVGVAVQFNVTITLSAAVANIGVGAQACQLSVQEVY